MDEYRFEVLMTVAIFLLTLLGFATEGISVLLYSLIALGALYLMYHNQEDQNTVSKRNYRRMAWLFTRLSPLDPTLRYDAKRIEQIIPNPTILQIDGLRSSEMGIQKFEMPRENQLPDLSEAEIAIAKIEERASIVLGSLVFIPILFALLHLFRYVPPISFSLEVITAVILGLILVDTQKIRYELTGWDEITDFLAIHRYELAINPRNLLMRHPLTHGWFQGQKIGFDYTPGMMKPAEFFLYLISKVIIELEPELRQIYLEKILEEVESLPGKEEIVTAKWSAYKIRLFLISISATALAALFSSLSSFSITDLNTEGFQFETTPYLVWGEYILVIVLNLSVLRLWYDFKKTIFYGMILTVIYFMMYFLNSIII